MKLTWGCGCVVWSSPLHHQEEQGLGWEPCPLHSAAPELLEACRRALAEAGVYGLLPETKKLLAEAIAKAES